MAGSASDVGILFLRVAGLGLASHGFDKVFHGDMSSFAGAVGKIGFPVPIVFAWAAALSELVGGTMVAIGLYTRFAALSAAFTMFVAAFFAHMADDFKVREPALVYLAVMLAVACLGGGRWSVDAVARKKAA